MSNARIEHDTRTVHTLHITLPDDVIAPLGLGDHVEIVLHSHASNRSPAPIRLSYTTLSRLLA